jgi:hypothetical protein
LLQIFRGAAATDVELQIQKWFQPRANILLTLSPGIADELGLFRSACGSRCFFSSGGCQINILLLLFLGIKNVLFKQNLSQSLNNMSGYQLIKYP